MLEVDTDASQDEIRSVCRREALRWQVDQNSDNPEPATRRFQHVHTAYLALREKEVGESCKENTDLQNTMPPPGGLRVMAEEWPEFQLLANVALRSWDEVLRRCNRHECDIMRFLVGLAESHGIDTDLFDLPSCYEDQGGTVSAGERERQLLTGKRALSDAISAAEGCCIACIVYSDV